MKVSNLSILACLMLTACGSYSNQFDCPIGQGLKCASLSEVNQKIDDGTLPFESMAKSNCPGCQKIHWRDDVVSSSGKGH
ncbi:MAG: hypothetical protein ACRYGR_05720 [Janthinobacterium lividum]